MKYIRILFVRQICHEICRILWFCSHIDYIMLVMTSIVIKWPQPPPKTSRKCVVLLDIDTNMDAKQTKKKRNIQKANPQEQMGFILNEAEFDLTAQ